MDPITSTELTGDMVDVQKRRKEGQQDIAREK